MDWPWLLVFPFAFVILIMVIKVIKSTKKSNAWRKYYGYKD